jgi:dihydrofolate reductase
MSKVIFVISMSLDGFMAGPNMRAEEPMGEGGLILHDWAMGSNPVDRQILEEGIGSIGAVISGRRNYDMAIPGWQADGPTGPARVPVFVVSHNEPQEVPENGVYTFVNGIDAAVAQAKATAGDKDISVMGGANIAQQFIKAGLVDEIQIQLVPVLLGSGLRMFEHLGDEQIRLETLEVKTGSVIHMRFRIVK